MYIVIDDETIVPTNFIVCELYGKNTCFCWSADKLIIFPYTDNSVVRDVQVLSTPNFLRKIQVFDGRVFFICTPQGAYKFSRAGSIALLSKNALDMGPEYYQVLITINNSIYLEDKKTKSSKLLFSVASKANNEVRTFPLILNDTEVRFIKCLTAGWETEKNLCVIAHDKKLFVLSDTVHCATKLIYISDNTIIDIMPVKRREKVAGLLLFINMNTMILVHGKNNLIFEKIHLRRNLRNISALCAGFSLQIENVLWIVYCDQFKMYYMRKELFTDITQETIANEKTFTCMQHYKPNIILGLSLKKELVELSLEELENVLPFNNIVDLCTDMFERTDLIMEKICTKVKELNMLYERLADEQDILRRVNLYASKQKLQVNPFIQISRLCNYCYLTLSIPEKLPKNCYVVFVLISSNQNTFCIKKVTESTFTVNIPVNENRISSSLTVNMDLITLMNEQHPWCLIQNFTKVPPQDLKKKRGSKKDKTAFIDAKVAFLQNLIAEKKDLSMTKLSEIKKMIRIELY